jgi:hypothetical protein
VVAGLWSNSLNLAGTSRVCGQVLRFLRRQRVSLRGLNKISFVPRPENAFGRHTRAGLRPTETVESLHTRCRLIDCLEIGTNILPVGPRMLELADG